MTTTEKILLSHIDASDGNVRFSLPAVKDLAASLEARGQLEPIGLRKTSDSPARYQIQYGHRRLAAATHLGWKSIDAIVTDATTAPTQDVVDRVSDQLAENSHEPLTVPEQIAAYALLKSQNQTPKQIAAAAGKSPKYVNNLLRCAALPDNVRQILTEADATTADWVRIAGLKTVGEQEVAALAVSEARSAPKAKRGKGAGKGGSKREARLTGLDIAVAGLRTLEGTAAETALAILLWATEGGEPPPTIARAIKAQGFRYDAEKEVLVQVTDD